MELAWRSGELMAAARREELRNMNRSVILEVLGLCRRSLYATPVDKTRSRPGISILGASNGRLCVGEFIHIGVAEWDMCAEAKFLFLSDIYHVGEKTALLMKLYCVKRFLRLAVLVRTGRDNSNAQHEYP